MDLTLILSAISEKLRQRCLKPDEDFWREISFMVGGNERQCENYITASGVHWGLRVELMDAHKRKRLPNLEVHHKPVKPRLSHPTEAASL
jgi:hypothetical protein